MHVSKSGLSRSLSPAPSVGRLHPSSIPMLQIERPNGIWQIDTRTGFIFHSQTVYVSAYKPEPIGRLSFVSRVVCFFFDLHFERSHCSPVKVSRNWTAISSFRRRREWLVLQLAPGLQSFGFLARSLFTPLPTRLFDGSVSQT